MILDADVTYTWFSFGIEAQGSEQDIPNGEEKSEVDISLSSPIDVV